MSYMEISCKQCTHSLFCATKDEHDTARPLPGEQQAKNMLSVHTCSFTGVSRVWCMWGHVVQGLASVWTVQTGFKGVLSGSEKVGIQRDAKGDTGVSIRSTGMPRGCKGSSKGVQHRHQAGHKQHALLKALVVAGIRRPVTHQEIHKPAAPSCN